MYLCGPFTVSEGKNYNDPRKVSLSYAAVSTHLYVRYRLS